MGLLAIGSFIRIDLSSVKSDRRSLRLFAIFKTMRTISVHYSYSQEIYGLSAQQRNDCRIPLKSACATLAWLSTCQSRYIIQDGFGTGFTEY